VISIGVKASGPLFDGTLYSKVALAVDAAEEEIATQGANHLRDDLGVPPFKNPTGWYRSHVTQKRMGAYWTIWDSGVIYGPWLAGVGSRNATSRFKGYAHWRRAVQHTRMISTPITDKFIARALRNA
jgi:hypothetical protein